MNKKNQKITTYFVLLSLLVIGVVFAILQANLQINGIAKIGSNTWDIHFDNIQVNENSVPGGAGDSAATIDPNDNCKVDFIVTLSLPGDFYEFTVNVVNAGTVDGMIGEINKTLKVNNEVVSDVPDYLNYNVTYDDGGPIIPNHLLEAGETLTYLVRLEFRTDIEELPEATTVLTTLEPQYIQADSGAIKKKPYYACTFDGELVQGAEYSNGQYTYRYMQEVTNYNSNTNVVTWSNISSDGWGVYLSDPTSTDSVNSRLCTSINNKPIVSTRYMFYNSQTTSIDTSSFDTSNVTNMSGMFAECSSLSTLDLSSFDTSNVSDMSGMFYHCTYLTELDLSDFNTSNVTNMVEMFTICSSLTTLNLSSFDTSNVTNMAVMFLECSKLTALDISSFDTSNVTDMSYMFNGCSKLTTLDISSFDTSNVTSISNMFSGCTSLTTLDLSSFDTSNVTTMDTMFNNCTNLEELNLSGFDLTKGSSFYSIAAGIFSSTSSLKKINLSNMKLPSDMSNAIFRFGGAYSSPIEEINVTGWDLSNTTNASGMFGSYGSNGKGGTGLKRIIGLDTWDTSHITNMSNMFSGLSLLQTIDLSSFNTSNVTNTANMFQGCSSLTTGYARTQTDADKFNASSNKPSGVTFVVKS